MPEMTSEEYAENRGVSCPLCGSDNIAGEDVEVLAEGARQDVQCLICDAKWTDVYKLIGYDRLER